MDPADVHSYWQFIHSFIHSSIHSFIHSLIHSFIHSCIHIALQWNYSRAGARLCSTAKQSLYERWAPEICAMGKRRSSRARQSLFTTAVLWDVLWAFFYSLAGFYCIMLHFRLIETKLSKLSHLQAVPMDSKGPLPLYYRSSWLRRWSLQMVSCR